MYMYDDIHFGLSDDYLNKIISAQILTKSNERIAKEIQSFDKEISLAADSYSTNKIEVSFQRLFGHLFRLLFAEYTNNTNNTSRRLVILNQEIADAIKDANEAIAEFKKALPEFKPFNAYLHMEHKLDLEFPEVTTFKTMKKFLDKLEDIASESDMDSIEGEFDTLFKFPWINCLNKLFNININVLPDYIKSVPALCKKTFFPGFVPDYAKIYREDIVDDIKKFNSIVDSSKKLTPKNVFKKGKELMSEVEQISLRGDKIVAIILANKNLPDDYKKKMALLAIDAVRKYMLIMYNVAIIHNNSGIWCAAAHLDKIYSFAAILRAVTK